MGEPTGVRRLARWVGVTAGVSGVLLAHAVAYRVVYPSATVRANVMAATGHGWWPAAATTGIVAAILALALSGARGFCGAPRTRQGPVPLAAFRAVLRLGAWQSGLFCAVEVVERLGAHASPFGLLHGPLLWIGIAVQVPVAVVAVAVLHLAERLGHRVAEVATRVRRPSPRPARDVWRSVRAHVPRAIVAWGLPAARAPPLPG